MNYTVIYDGKIPDSFGIRVAERPDIPTAAPRYTETTVTAVDGSYLTDTGYYEDIEIEVNFSWDISRNDWMWARRKLAEWLYGATDKKLIFSDDMEHFYKVKVATIDTAERENHRIGKCKVTFRCDPYSYLTEGTKTFTGDSPFTVYNPGSAAAHPVYYIPVAKSKPNVTLEVTPAGTTGTKFITITTNSGFTLDGTVVIDTERMIAYWTTGKITSIIDKNIDGNYEDLWMSPGTTYSVKTYYGTSSGSVILNGASVIPNWRDF